MFLNLSVIFNLDAEYLNYAVYDRIINLSTILWTFKH